MEKKRTRLKAGRPATQEIPAPAGAVQIETFVPLKMAPRTLKKRVIAPDGVASSINHSRQSPRFAESARPLVKALGLAHYWQYMLNAGTASSVTEIAQAECVDVTHVRRLIRLSLLSPEFVERLIASSDISLEWMMRQPVPDSWTGQMRLLKGIPATDRPASTATSAG